MESGRGGINPGLVVLPDGRTFHPVPAGSRPEEQAGGQDARPDDSQGFPVHDAASRPGLG